MFRSLWSTIRDRVWNSITGLFRTQTEIDTYNRTDLSSSGTVIQNPADLPGSAKRRKNGIFVSPDDAKDWLKRAAIPTEYVTILEIDDWEDDNKYFHIYVIDGGDL
jgi:hypothetical protein